MPIMLERTADSKARELERCAIPPANLLKPPLILATRGVVLVIVPSVMMPFIGLSKLVQ